MESSESGPSVGSSSTFLVNDEEGSGKELTSPLHAIIQTALLSQPPTYFLEKYKYSMLGLPNPDLAHHVFVWP